MTPTLRAEFRKLRFSRSLAAFPAAAALISAISSTVLISTFKSVEIGNELSAYGPLRFGATNVGLFLLLFGVRVFTDETQHRTLPSTYIATPDRRVVLAAKAVTTVVVAVATCAVIYAFVVPVTLFGVHQRGLRMATDAAATACLGLRVVAAMVLMVLLGLALGVALRNRTVALVAAVAWLALGETLVGGLLRAPKMMPGSLVSGLVANGGADAYSAVPAAALLTAWLAAVVTAALFSLRRDVG